MAKYFANIYDTVNTLWKGMRITWRHMINIKRDNVTLQYPEERWPQPERNIGFEHADYNVIRSRLHVDIDDCIDRKSTRLNSSHALISYAVFCLKKKKQPPYIRKSHD